MKTFPVECYLIFIFIQLVNYNTNNFPSIIKKTKKKTN